ncbi:MAG: cell envelope integrity protein TolA [Pseudomonadota bacterium]|uniref:cell envelope integrity protein TolA n=1 Tax=Alcanivorax sp. NBRC 102024 TaxID=1113895 RepID=UPI000789EE04|nr:cell envelope integrity protein TolA [Alcanivorax sp. NBRC 102024]MEE2603606.1 cell envelope integrity protein TolA [Pseudomonadota bacterium]
MSDRGAALLFTLFIHLLVFGLLVFSWSTDPALHKAPVIPPHVKATMVETSKQKKAPVSKPKPEQKPAPKPEPKPKPKPKPKPEPKPEPKKPEPKPKPKPEPTKKPDPKPAPKPDPKPDPKPVIPDIEEPSLEEMLAEEELEMAKPMEPSQQESQDAVSNADQSDVEVASFKDQIGAAIYQRWRIPGNYRNRDDLKVIVRIHLIPGGEVVNVTVVETSGYPQLDESIVNAVELASPLPVPSGETFNQNFRSFLFGFVPKGASQ